MMNRILAAATGVGALMAAALLALSMEDAVDGTLSPSAESVSRSAQSMAELELPASSVDESRIARAPGALVAERSRLASNDWMSIRNAVYDISAEQRLDMLLRAHHQLIAMEHDCAERRQRIVHVASLAVATRLDALGQATSVSQPSNDRQWKFSTDGAFYIFEKGRFGVYDDARAVMDSVARRVDELSGDSMVSPDLLASPESVAGADSVSPELLASLDSFVDETVDLLTRR